MKQLLVIILCAMPFWGLSQTDFVDNDFEDIVPRIDGEDDEDTTRENKPIPYPTFLDNEKLEEWGEEPLNVSKKNRVLLINSIPATDLRLYKEGGDRAFGLRNGGSLSVLIEYYQFRDLESVTFSLNGKDYSYEKGVLDIKADLEIAEEENEELELEIKGLDIPKSRNSWISSYLSDVLTAITTPKILNLNDLLTLQAFQKKLRDSWDITQLKPADLAKFNQIINHHPDFVSLTPIPLTFDEADEVEVSMALKTAGSSTAKEHDLGTYRTVGGFGISVGNQIFVTGLKNNAVYTDSLLVTEGQDSTNQLRAFLDDENQTSIGVGVNAEMYFRTGSWFKPTINLGFFVPFEEDITPFIGLAPGFSLGNGNVKFSGSFGIALGSVNAIKPEYRDTDLARFGGLTNDKLTHKVWKSSWLVGFGISYNLK